MFPGPERWVRFSSERGGTLLHRTVEGVSDRDKQRFGFFGVKSFREDQRKFWRRKFFCLGKIEAGESLCLSKFRHKSRQAAYPGSPGERAGFSRTESALGFRPRISVLFDFLRLAAQKAGWRSHGDGLNGYK